MTLTRKKVRGGPNDPALKKPFVDAAFSDSIVLCATFDPVHLPTANAPDNIYDRQDDDGHICRR